MAIILGSLALASPKPVFNKEEDEQPFQHQLFLSQNDVLEPQERIIDDHVWGDEIDELVKYRIAHNRTARNAHGCVSKRVTKFDKCRNKMVAKVTCRSIHPVCNHVIPKHFRPKCEPVMGFWEASFITKCPPLTIECQCAS